MKQSFVKILLFILLATVSNSFAQTWRIYSPPNKSFIIRLPAPLRPEKYFDDDADLSPDPNGYTAINFYGARQSSPKLRSFLIMVINVSEGLRKKNPNGNELGGLEFMIGGDNGIPTSESNINFRGLRGKEFIYATKNILTGGRILDAGKRIYLLSLKAENAEDLISPSAERFFGSFRPSKQK
ncbi:MAG: hypothetical protein ACR2N3_02885 [Pyrinomonadaceae bacterium]